MSQLAVVAGLAALVAAYQRGDRTKIEQIGASERAAGISLALASEHRTAQLAGIAAAPAAEDAWFLLLPLARLAGAPDRRVAAGAARAAVVTAREFDHDRRLELEVPEDLINDRFAAWTRLLHDPGRWADIRVHALATAIALAQSLTGVASRPSVDLLAVITDSEPELRRAAYELAPVPLPIRLRGAAAQAIASDEMLDVALAAAQALCAAPAATSSGPGGADLTDPVEAIAPAALDRLRQLILEPEADPAAAADAANCLIAAGGPANLRAVRILRGRVAAPLRRRLSRTLDKASAERTSR
jgi:hypothetical protein